MASSYEYDFDENDHDDSLEEQVAASFHLFDVDDSDDEYDEMLASRSQSNDACSDYESNDQQQQEVQSRASGYSFDDNVEFSSDDEDVKKPPSRTVPQQQSEDASPKKSQSKPLGFSMLRKDKSLIERARIRHRRRRYDLFSNLLVSASDLLLLDRSHAKAFIPMLRSLLTPPKKASVEEPILKQSESKPAMWLRRATTMGLPASTTNDDESTSGYKSDPGITLVDESDSNQDDDEEESESEEIPPTPTNDFDDDDRYFLLRDLADSDILRAFLESLSPGAGFRCLSLMLLQHLLRSEQGYDARVRHVFKKLGVIVLVHEMEREQYSFGPDGEKIQLLTNSELAQLATRKFEALEHGIAAKLIRLSEMQRQGQGREGRRGARGSGASGGSSRQLKRGLTREQLVRGLKVGSAGVVAGTLFAVTGGLAAPGIAAGIAAIAGGAAATAAVVTLTSTAAVTAIFGVGGGSLAAYKMQRRTQGLTEFKFQKESQARRRRIKGREGKTRIEPELFSTICISGWLRDNCDFQRPWGVSPTNPPIVDRLELLERFYSVHNPDHISRCGKILSKWKNEEAALWGLLKKKYGRDPDELFPIENGKRLKGSLTLEEDEVLDQLFVELGHISEASFLDEEARSMWKSSFASRPKSVQEESPPRGASEFQESRSTSLEDSLRGSRTTFVENRGEGEVTLLTDFGNSAPDDNNNKNQKDKETSTPKHLLTVWDYQATYGGELYTIKWESKLLMELCDSVTDMAVEFLENATRQILKATALSTLLTAVAVPTVMLQAMNVIDGSWTLAVERADEAGKELAKSLLFSRAGHRPVTLVGFSMGARVIYCCLKELARYQEKWEDSQESQPHSSSRGRKTKKKASSDDDEQSELDDKVKVIEGMREPASIVEDAILMGLPNHMNLTTWEACRQIVGGRLINCYSRKDLILSLMFQSKKITSGLKKVCGTCAIDVPGVENYDVTDIVTGHQDYCFVAGDILKRVRHGQPIRRHQGAEVKFNEEVDGVGAPQT